MSDRLNYLCNKDLRTHTDADLDDDISELQELAMRVLQDIRMKAKHIKELEAKVARLTSRGFEDLHHENEHELYMQEYDLKAKLDRVRRLAMEWDSLSPTHVLAILEGERE